MKVDFNFKEKYDFGDLCRIMTVLRKNCPWDKEQDHTSIRNNMLEEAYEVADAIDTHDNDALLEELGDVLLQVVFHSEIEREKGTFDIGDVSDGICKKLIHRHPHIFADVNVSGTDDVLNNWDGIKREEKGQNSYTDTLNSVPKAFPALMRAQKVQKRAAKAGFDWDNIDGAKDKIMEETGEVISAFESGDSQAVAEEIGDLLFSVVNVSRFLHVDAEEALCAATDKFISRFAKVEQLAAQHGIEMESADIDQLDRLWDQAKIN